MQASLYEPKEKAVISNPSPYIYKELLGKLIKYQRHITHAHVNIYIYIHLKKKVPEFYFHYSSQCSQYSVFMKRIRPLLS